MAAVLLALPVYGISNELFKLAVCRDNSVSLFQRKGVRKLAERLNEVIAGRGRNGETERNRLAENGRQMKKCRPDWALPTLLERWRKGKPGSSPRKKRGLR